jgi:CRP/FNR family transcriptional regulator, cyclic AMP receptor protein
VDADLGEMPLFEGLPTKTLRVVSQLSTPIELRAGTALAREGTTGREFFMLLDGEVDVIRARRLVATRGPGSHLGEIALLERRPRTATLVAKTAVLVAIANRGEFDTLLQRVPEISERLDATMTRRLAELATPTGSRAPRP